MARENVCYRSCTVLLSQGCGLPCVFKYLKPLLAFLSAMHLHFHRYRVQHILYIFDTRWPIISLKVLYKGLNHHEHPRFYCHHGSFSHRNRHRYQYRACHPAYHTWQPPTHPTLAGGMSPCWCGPSCRCGRCIHEEPPLSIYLVDYACYYAGPTCRLPISSFIEHCKLMPSFYDDRHYYNKGLLGWVKTYF